MRSKCEKNTEKQSLKEKLLAIVLLEVSKPYREMDCDLVDECIDFLVELEGKERLSKSEIKERIKDIPFKGRVTALGSDVKKKVRAKRLALIAAVLALIVVIFGIFTLASEDPFSDLLYKMGHSLMELLDDSSIDYMGVTMYNNDENKTYPTIEELIEAENLNVLYPTWLPDEEKVIKVVYIREGEDEQYTISCAEPMHSISIYPGKVITGDIKRDCLMKKTNRYEVYYFVSEGYAQGNLVYNNNLYTVGADNEENLFKIIENLREIN